MSDRVQHVLAAMALGSLMVASCSRPAEPPASPAASDTKAPDAQTAANAPAPAPVAQPAQHAPAKKATEPKLVDLAPTPVPPAPVAVATPAPAPDPVPSPLPVASAPVPVVVAAPPPPPPVPTTRDISLPTGTLVALRMIDPVDSKTDHVGQTFKASIDAPVIVDGLTVLPKNGDAFVKLTKVQTAGKLSGTSELELQLDRVFIGNKSYTVTSNVFQSEGSSQGKKAVKQTGIGAGLGAIIGAIAGGKKGAAIGAGVGGGAGATATAVENGEQVRVESEAKITFRLEQQLDVTIPAGGAIAPATRSNPISPGRP